MVSSSATSFQSTAFVLSLSTILSLLLSLTFLQTTHAATPDEWRSRSIYQIITDRFARTDGSISAPCNVTAQLYCGGTFEGIINQLDYIQGMGFTAIWISPVVSNIPETTKYGQGYHGFWTNDITKINEHFGAPADLTALSKAVHDRGMYIMIDVVVNDLAYAGPGAKVDYSILTPFNKQEYFHPFCYIKDYSNSTNAQQCWLGDDTVSLPDLDTESEVVQNIWHTWISEMVANYSLDGLRIDAAKHVNKEFWTPFQQAANVFTIGEVFDQDPNSTCFWAVDALDSVLNYPAWYAIVNTLANVSNPMGGLGYVVQTIATNCHDSTLLGTFSENHDVARFGSVTKDLSQQKNALTFNLMTDGIPVVYYGAEQRFSGKNDPENREALWLAPSGYNIEAPLYKHISTLNIARTAVTNQLNSSEFSNWSGYWAYKAKILYSTDDILVFRKGYDTSIITALTNVGEGGKDVGPYHMGDTNLIEGATIVEVLSCNSTKLGQFGEFDLTLKNGEPQVWVPAKYLETTPGLCSDLMRELNRTGASKQTKSAGNRIQSYTILSSLPLAVLYVAVVIFGS